MERGGSEEGQGEKGGSEEQEEGSVRDREGETGKEWG